MFKYISAFIALFWSYQLFPQPSPLYNNATHYTTENGLPQNYVSSIVQDHDGFIWIATLDGIARFDGKKFIEFNITSDSSRKISTPRVLDLRIDKDNNLWILHFNHKIDRMNPQTFEVERDLTPILQASFEDFPLALSYKRSFHFSFDETLDNDHWFVKNKIDFQLFDTTNFKLKNLFLEKKPKGAYRFAFDEDDQGRLWILEDSALLVSDTTWTQFETIQFPKELNFGLDSLSKLNLLANISGGRILIFANERLIIYDEPQDQFRELQLPVRRSKQTNHATIATRDQEGRVVFKYYGYVFRVNEDESITTLWKFPRRDRFLISSLLVAKDGTLWAGINTGGLYQINTLIPSFHSKKYEQNFVVDLLVNELSIEPSQIPRSWLQNKGSYDFRYFYSKGGRLYFTQDGYYFGRQNRICYLDKGQIKTVKSAKSTIYYKGFHEEDGFLAAIDSYGQYVQWDDISSIPKISACINIGLPNNFQLIDAIYANGFTWVTNSQNNIYQLKKGQLVKTYDVGDKNFGLIQVQPDLTNEDIFWIGTYGGGLLKWDYTTNEVKKTLTTNDGLPDNTIAAMVPDENGNIWMSTFNGVSRFDPRSESFTSYSTSDGLIQSEFDRHHGFKLPDGRIAFGGSEGYSVFDPALFVEDQYSPEIKLAHLFINNKEQLYADSSSLIRVPLNQLEKLVLNYQNNSIAFEVMANQFNNPDKTAYRHKLTGYHTDWVENSDSRKIQFEKLQAGTYSLFINASNTNGIWSKHIREIQIRVLPPPWLSWWAYSIYFMIGCCILFIYWRIYKRNLIRKQDEEFNRREAKRLKEVDDMKTRFFSNITHEFRTPLTLILSPLEKQLRDNKYPLEVQHILESNYRHGSHLLKLVNELLDISKLESGFMQQHKSTGELDRFARECLNQFENLAKQKKIQLVYKSEHIEGYYHFDKSHLEKIITNLLSNAIKFTPSGGLVTLTITAISEAEVCIEVTDTGIGIPNELMDKLFDRFYQVDDSTTREQEGTGIGLSLVRELAELMGGVIEVESKLGEGSTFKLTLPFEKVSDERLPAYSVEVTHRKVDSEIHEDAPVVLVVEDNPELRPFIVESLPENWVVLEASEGKEGQSRIYESLPDIVISDVMMPVMDGYQLCKETKSDPRTSHIHFILLTAKTAQESKVLGLEAGADDYLTKPFQFYELELRIQNALQKQENLRNRLTKELVPSVPKQSLPKVEDQFLAGLYQYLDEHLNDEHLSVESIAREMAMSKSTLNRKLRALLDLSAVEMIKNYRMQKAAVLMATGDSISNIAYEVGISSPSYFSQCFKESFNISPTEYQKRLTDGLS